MIKPALKAKRPKCEKERVSSVTAYMQVAWFMFWNSGDFRVDAFYYYMTRSYQKYIKNDSLTNGMYSTFYLTDKDGLKIHVPKQLRYINFKLPFPLLTQKNCFLLNISVLANILDLLFHSFERSALWILKLHVSKPLCCGSWARSPSGSRICSGTLRASSRCIRHKGTLRRRL